jgi:hypothetical protein
MPIMMDNGMQLSYESARRSELDAKTIYLVIYLVNGYLI